MNDTSRAFRYQLVYTIPNSVNHANIPEVAEKSDKKVNTLISTNIEGKHRKQSTANQEQQSSPVLHAVACKVHGKCPGLLSILDY